MDERTADAYVDTALGLSTTLYALFLDYNKQHARSQWKIDPDWTWATVALGCAMCLLAARIKLRLTQSIDRATTERAVRRAFVVGGIPVVVWQIWHNLARLRARVNTLRHYDPTAEEPHAQQSAHPAPTRLAAFRPPDPRRN